MCWWNKGQLGRCLKCYTWRWSGGGAPRRAGGGGGKQPLGTWKGRETGSPLELPKETQPAAPGIRTSDLQWDNDLCCFALSLWLEQFVPLNLLKQQNKEHGNHLGILLNTKESCSRSRRNKSFCISNKLPRWGRCCCVFAVCTWSIRNPE